MKTYPDIAYDPEKYAEELGRHLDNPFRKALVEITWHGTSQYQKMIERDGMAAQQKILAEIRETIAKLRTAAATAEESNKVLDGQAQDARRQAGEAAREITYRDHHGRLATRDNSAQVAKHRALEQQLREACDKHRKAGAWAQQQAVEWQAIDAKLTAALLMYQYNAEKRAAAPVIPPPPPVFHIHNRIESPVVNLEANLPAPEVTVNLPTRKTETTIFRDRTGNIASATQIETDA
jgi:hypothetical protein